MALEVIRSVIKGRHAHLDIGLEGGDLLDCEVRRLNNGRYVAVVIGCDKVGSAPHELTEKLVGLLERGVQVKCIVTGDLRVIEPQFQGGNGIVQSCVFLWVKEIKKEAEISDIRPEFEESSAIGDHSCVSLPVKEIKKEP